MPFIKLLTAIGWWLLLVLIAWGYADAAQAEECFLMKGTYYTTLENRDWMEKYVNTAKSGAWRGANETFKEMAKVLKQSNGKIQVVKERHPVVGKGSIGTLREVVADELGEVWTDKSLLECTFAVAVDEVTIITPGITARLCRYPECVQNRHITRIPEGTTLEVTKIDTRKSGMLPLVTWFEVTYKGKKGWISIYDTDKK